MTTKKISIPKYFFLISVFVIGLMSCERDFKDIGIALVDNNKFDTKVLISDIIAYNKKIDSVRVDSMPQYVLGVNKNGVFGKTTASIAAQLALAPSTNFGENPKIDSVILDIPYYNRKTGTKKVPNFATEDLNDSIAVPIFELDSILGNRDTKFTINVYELGTFLNALDPLDPTRKKRYFSNRSYAVVGTELYTGLFKPNADDTVAYIKYRDPLSEKVFDIDTIKRVGSIPTIKMPLNEDFFSSKFLPNGNSAEFSSTDEFIHFFRGLYIEASGTDGTLLTLPLQNGSITIFYSNDASSTDAGGVTTVTRQKQKMIFPLTGIRTNKFEHNYSLATSSIQNKLLNPDKVNGEQKLYIQGTSGVMAVLNLFTKDDLEAIRSKNWLINEANIKVYVDKDETGSDVPNRLFLYNLDNNAQILDVISEGTFNFGGTLEYDADGKPDFYKFKITDYIASILKRENTREPSKLALKAFSSYNIPSFLRASDTIIKPYDWNTKGVAVFGNKEMSAKKLVLEVFYTEPKN